MRTAMIGHVNITKYHDVPPSMDQDIEGDVGGDGLFVATEDRLPLGIVAGDRFTIDEAGNLLEPMSGPAVWVFELGWEQPSIVSGPDFRTNPEHVNWSGLDDENWAAAGLVGSVSGEDFAKLAAKNGARCDATPLALAVVTEDRRWFDTWAKNPPAALASIELVRGIHELAPLRSYYENFMMQRPLFDVKLGKWI